MRVHLNSSRFYHTAGRLQAAGVVNPNLLTIQLIGYGSGGSVDNIVMRSDVGQFKYIGGKIHALSYTDNAATQVSTQTQKVSYTPFHRPDSLMEGDWLMTFAYGPDYERRRTDLYKLGTLTERRHYFGSGSERHENVTTGTSRDLFYIPGPDGLAAIMKREGSVVQLYFPYADHLGSVTSLTDELGNVVCRQAFDPWGRRRNPGSLLIDDNALPANFSWLRGFTGHEHLPQFRLINMNARLYDPLLGRMLSPDNYVTDASNAMTYNLYSYANNNPVSNIDPDGNFVFTALALLIPGAQVFLPIAIGADIGAFTGGIRGDMTSGVGFWKGATRGAIIGAIGGALGMVGGGNFVANMAWRAAEGAITGSVDAALWGTDVGKGMLKGAAIGAAFGLVSSEEFGNMVRGQGFRTNDKVLSSFTKDGNYQEALDHFKMKGTYTTDQTVLQGNPAVTDPNTGKIYFGDYSFSKNYDHLKLIADHEMIHSSNVLKAIQGNWINTKRYLEFTDPGQYMNLEEFNTHKYNYLRQGLYPKHGTNIINKINGYGTQIGVREFNSKWWHFIYKIPRRW